MRTARTRTAGRCVVLHGVRLGVEKLEMRLCLDGSLEPAHSVLTASTEPLGGPIENQSRAWSGYDEPAAAAGGGVANSTQIVIAGVPKYLWYRGCGPTAAGMVVGYWDMHGYSALISGNSSVQTVSVNNAIASPAHYNDYSKPIDSQQTGVRADKSSLGGAHANNSIADWMRTSWSADSMCYGWSTFGRIGTAIDSYCDWKGYSNFTTTSKTWGELTWNDFKAEIDAGRPMVFLVDTTGSGSTDHFVPVVGYDATLHHYACYNTWDARVHWYDFAQLAQGQEWGIYGAILVNPNRTPPTITISNANLREGNAGTSRAIFSVTLLSPTTRQVTMNYTTEDGTATAGDDYLETSGTLTFQPGEVRKNIAVPVNGDKCFENDETFTLNLSDASGATIDRGIGTCTILNNDKLPTVAIDKVRQPEGDSGTSDFTFNVTLSGPSSLPITVQYSTADGTATAGSDYTGIGLTTLTFDPGDTVHTVPVTVQGDTLFETDEAFTVNLSNPVGAAIAKGKGIGKGTIQNDDHRTMPIGGSLVAQAKGTSTFDSPDMIPLVDALAALQQRVLQAGKRQQGPVVDETIRLIYGRG